MNILSKFQNRYFSSKVFFVLDLTLSVGASVLVLLVLSYFSSSDYNFSSFDWWWIGGAFVASVIAMLVFREYKLVVRYSAFHDLLCYFLTFLAKDILLGIVIGVGYRLNFGVLLALCCDFLLTLFLALLVRIVMVNVYDRYKSRLDDMKNRQ